VDEKPADSSTADLFCAGPIRRAQSRAVFNLTMVASGAYKAAYNFATTRRAWRIPTDKP